MLLLILGVCKTAAFVGKAMIAKKPGSPRSKGIAESAGNGNGM